MEKKTTYRNSKQRQNVYSAVVESGIHPTADWVYQHLRSTDPNISLGTVYRNLDVLCKIGKIARVGQCDGPEAFDRNPIPHYHMVCGACGCIEDLPIAYLETLDEQVRKAGFAVTGHRILFDGVCPACMARQSSRS